MSTTHQYIETNKNICICNNKTVNMTKFELYDWNYHKSDTITTPKNDFVLQPRNKQITVSIIKNILTLACSHKDFYTIDILYANAMRLDKDLLLCLKTMLMLEHNSCAISCYKMCVCV
jgi:hypothetical protein